MASAFTQWDISLANSSSSLEATQKARCIGMNNNAIPALLEGEGKQKEQNFLELCSIAVEKDSLNKMKGKN